MSEVDRLLKELDRLLKEFVDRKAEVARFDSFFRDPDKVGLAIIGPEGRGKSTLRFKLVRKCLNDELPHSVLASTSDDSPDFQKILNSCCEKLGETQFPRFIAAQRPPAAIPVDINLRADSSIRMLENAQIPGTVGNVTGIALNNAQFTVSSTPSAMSMERRRLLTDAFLADLRALNVAAPLIVFLDGAEKMMPETIAWLWQKFVPELGRNELRPVKIVFFSQKEPETEMDAEFYIEKAQLPPLDVPDIAEYVQLKGLTVNKDIATMMATMIKTDTNGEPLLVVQKTESYRRALAASAPPQQ